jgi:hypothetical protein
MTTHLISSSISSHSQDEVGKGSSSSSSTSIHLTTSSFIYSFIQNVIRVGVYERCCEVGGGGGGISLIVAICFAIPMNYD